MVQAETREKPDETAPTGSRHPRCPECGSVRVWRDGWRLRDGRKVQRWICRNCSFRFTDPAETRKVNHKVQNPVDKRLNTAPVLTLMDGSLRCRVREDIGVEEKPLTWKQPAGGTTASDREGLLLNFAVWLKRQGLKDATIQTYISLLRQLSKRADLHDPEEVKDALAKSNYSEGSKNLMATVYDNFLKFIEGSWQKPKFKSVEKIPFIPLEKEIDDLIAAAGWRLAPLLQLLKETGMRVGEALQLKWMDIDFERRVVRITPEKGSRPRILPVSSKLIAMLNRLPKTGERVFPTSEKSLRICLMRLRKKLARKLNNPRLLKITFHTFRHWKATMEYHKTKDIIHVKELLGHKKIENTMIYISIEKALFQEKSDEFYCRTAKTVEEAARLIEAGFEHVTTFNGVMLFRKHK